MKQFNITAKATALFFLISDVFSIIALGLYQPLLNNPSYITSSNTNNSQIVLGAFFELLVAISVAGTAITLYPVLKKQNLTLSLAYVIGRAAEAMLITIGLMSLLTLLTLQHSFLLTAENASIYQTIEKAFVALHDWTFLLGPNIILSINATVLGYLLYKSRVVPRQIALLALVDGPILFVSGILILFGVYKQVSVTAAILAFPMLLFEVSFSLWLLTKGFEIKIKSPGN